MLLLPAAGLFNSIGILIPGVLLYWIASDFDIHNWKHGLKLFFTWILFVLVLLVMTTVTKRLFNRNRPKVYGVTRMCNLRKTETNKSMPSGDTAQATLYACFLVAHLHVHWSVLFIILLVAFARVFYYCDWIGDTMAGALCGVLSLILSVFFQWAIN